MAFVVEDGTKPAGANAYASLADVNAYFTDRGVTAWVGSDPVKQIAIVKATDYIEARFSGKFRGRRESRDQSLSWPRHNAVDNDGYLICGADEIPRKLIAATAEYALRALTAALISDPGSPTEAPGKIVSVREKVGPIEEETRYETGSAAMQAAGTAPKSSLVSAYNIPEYPAADLLLEGLLVSSMSRTLVRG